MRQFIFLITIWIFIVACNEEQEVAPDPFSQYQNMTLREAATFPVGLAVTANKFDNSTYANLVSREFNSVTAEWQMKMKAIFKGPDQYDFTGADEIVAFARQHDMQVHGHALVWHISTPDWMLTYEATPEEWEQLVRNYIHTVVSRYKDDVISWDVVNEAFENNNFAMRQSLFYEKLGPDYLAKVYTWAREADPDCLLFYNEYGTPYDTKKRAAMIAMIDDFQERGIPLDGVGLQLHISHDWPPLADIQQTVNLILARNLKVHFSEIDIKLNSQGKNNTYTEALADAQRERMKALVQLYKGIPGNQQFAITFWGLKDNDSWLLKQYDRPDWPLLFDENYQKKAVYYGFLQGLE